MRIKLGVSMTLNEISSAIGGKLLCNRSPVIEYITTDSREASIGDLYIPIKGSRFDGEDFVQEAISKGLYVVSAKNDFAHIKVDDSSFALLDLANHYIKNLPYILYKVGITGSVGKTTTKEFLKEIASKLWR